MEFRSRKAPQFPRKEMNTRISAEAACVLINRLAPDPHFPKVKVRNLFPDTTPQPFTFAELKELVKTAEIVRIKLSDLKSSQNALWRYKLENHVMDLHRSRADSQVPAEVPVVVKCGEELKIADGNHTLASRVLRGRKHAHVYLITHGTG